MEFYISSQYGTFRFVDSFIAINIMSLSGQWVYIIWLIIKYNMNINCVVFIITFYALVQVLAVK